MLPNNVISGYGRSSEESSQERGVVHVNRGPYDTGY